MASVGWGKIRRVERVKFTDIEGKSNFLLPPFRGKVGMGVDGMGHVLLNIQPPPVSSPWKGEEVF